MESMFRSRINMLGGRSLDSGALLVALGLHGAALILTATTSRDELARAVPPPAVAPPAETLEYVVDWGEMASEVDSAAASDGSPTEVAIPSETEPVPSSLLPMDSTRRDAAGPVEPRVAQASPEPAVAIPVSTRDPLANVEVALTRSQDEAESTVAVRGDHSNHQRALDHIALGHRLTDGIETGGATDGGMSGGDGLGRGSGGGASENGAGQGRVGARTPRLVEARSCNDLFPWDATSNAVTLAIEVSVQNSGTAHLSRVLGSGSPREFRDAARLCAERLRFAPARDKDGRTIAASATVQLHFARGS